MHSTVRFAEQQVGNILQREAGGASALDVGTGNGTLAIELRQRGFRDVTGTDYSEKSLALASAVAEHKKVAGVRWVLDDILHTRLTSRYRTSWALFFFSRIPLTVPQLRTPCIIVAASKGRQ